MRKKCRPGSTEAIPRRSLQMLFSSNHPVGMRRFMNPPDFPCGVPVGIHPIHSALRTHPARTGTAAAHRRRPSRGPRTGSRSPEARTRPTSLPARNGLRHLVRVAARHPDIPEGPNPTNPQAPVRQLHITHIGRIIIESARPRRSLCRHDEDRAPSGAQPRTRPGIVLCQRTAARTRVSSGSSAASAR